MAKQLKTSSEVIDTLGGLTVVGRITGHSYKAVWWWRHRGFPPDTFLVLKAALAERDLEAPDSLWGMREAAAAS